MISQGALSITHSKIHTVEYYMKVVDKLVEFGADEIGLKDMAGVGRPVTLGKLTKAIKDKYPHIVVQYHGHCGPGFSPASMLEVARNGADIIDVAVEPLSWGKIHPDVITIREMLYDAGFDVPEINMNAYMKVRTLNQKYMDDFLGYFMEMKNRQSSSLLVRCGLPGGMMGSMMSDLKSMHSAINVSLQQSGKPTVSIDDLLVQLFEEVEYVWPKLGYPPLVTPFSQYVKNIALMNIYAMSAGQPRFSMIDKDSWNMILGRMGKLPGELAPEIVELAKSKGYEFFTGNPQDEYPDALESYRQEMQAKGWDCGQDDEELFELAMHDRQYRDYKSGIAKKRFNEELEVVKNNENKVVQVEDDKDPKIKKIKSPETGRLLFAFISDQYKVGDQISVDEQLFYVESNTNYEVVISEYAGTIGKLYCKQGDWVHEGDTIMTIVTE